jgi:hypothetical protein
MGRTFSLIQRGILQRRASCSQKGSSECYCTTISPILLSNLRVVTALVVVTVGAATGGLFVAVDEDATGGFISSDEEPAGSSADGGDDEGSDGP